MVSTLGWYPIKFAKAQSNPFLKLLCKVRSKSEYEEAVSIYSNCDLMIDISGYALGSNWSDKICSDFLDNIEFAKAFNIPVILMPQSFGPFEYDENSVIEKRIKELLPYVSVICAREKEGYDYLVNKYNLSNVVLKTDIVLNSNLDLHENLKYENYKIPDIPMNSVAVMPNDRMIRVFGEEKAILLYSNIISCLRDKNINVFLISHSQFDLELCNELKNIFISDDKVRTFRQDFSCIEFNELVKKFKFCVASRFHSVVHAYKNSVPCIIFGWAVKYKELANLVNQDKYVLSIEKALDKNLILGVIDEIVASIDKESNIISSKLDVIQTENVFDLLSGIKVNR